MNIAHIFETALFILAAFIIGAVLGYLIRCMFFRPKAAAATVAATVAVAAVAPKPSPKPVASSPAAAKPAATKPVASKPAVAKPATPKATSPKPTKSPIPAAAADADGKPIGLSGPRNGKKDDLKLIKGIGVKIEGTLNGLGIYHFDQVGGWSSKTVEWINGFISFKGRIQREKWISQAKALAEGKSTEFSKRVDKGQVPSSKK